MLNSVGRTPFLQVESEGKHYHYYYPVYDLHPFFTARSVVKSVKVPVVDHQSDIGSQNKTAERIR